MPTSSVVIHVEAMPAGMPTITELPENVAVGSCVLVIRSSKKLARHRGTKWIFYSILMLQFFNI